MHRDVASVILLLLLAIAAVGLVMYGLDLPKGILDLGLLLTTEG